MRYTPSHEWIKIEDGVGTVGITSYAVKELGEIVYVQLPLIGTVLKQGQEAVILESTKAAADIYSPLEGIVIAINEALLQDLSAINSMPEKEGWLFQIQVQQEAETLLTQEEYKKMLNS